MNVDPLDSVIYNKKDSTIISCTDCDDAILVRMFNAATKGTQEDSALPMSTVKDAVNGISVSSKSDPNSPLGKLSNEWKVGEKCMALYEEDGKYYPARIVQILPQDGTCEVEYIGYDDSNTLLDLKNLLREEEVEILSECSQAGSFNDDNEAAKTSTTPVTNEKAFVIPDLCPPPPSTLLAKVAKAGNEKEALTNMLMSWYMSGYHTGYFEGMRKAREENQ